MKRNTSLCLVLGFALVGSLATGCGDSGNGNDDGGHGLGDGHVQAGCNVDPDCDDGNPCHMGKCNIVTHMCMFNDKQCPPMDDCNTGMCDPSSGDCNQVAANEGGTCTTQQGTAGSCISGFCQPVPSCWDPQNSFGQLQCSNDFFSADSNSNDSLGFGSTNAITAYGNCATGEVAPEIAYQFNGGAADQVVTVHLALDASQQPDGGADPDLDLIVIEGPNCVTASPCANPARGGGGFQGITAGTSDETVTFTAKAGMPYYIVVDGKGSGNYKIEMQACGKCQPTPTTTLSCNMSMSISGNTSSGASQLASYTCPNTGGTGTTMLAGAGKEQVFFYESLAPVKQKVKATLTGASADLTLAAVPLSTVNECNPAACVAGATTTGTSPNKTASISFDAQPNDTFSPARYFVVVDGQTAAPDTTYGLQFSCMPYCANDNSLACTNGTAAANSNNGTGTGNTVSAWGPMGAACGGMTNLSGHEYVYLFTKQVTTGTSIRFTLAAVTANKHLGLVILDAGTMGSPACDPSSTCATTAPVTIAGGGGTLPSTGTYVAQGPTTMGGTDAKTAVVDLTVPQALHYYWVVVDGVNGDASDFAIAAANCM